METGFQIRAIEPREFKIITDLARTQEWFVCEEDSGPLFSVDPQGMFISEVNGDVMGMVFAMKHQTYAHIDLYFIKEEYRGKGYGIKVFKHAIEHIKDTKVLGLMAVEDQVSNYEKWGFRLHSTIGHYKRIANGSMGANLVDLKNFSFEQLLEYDKETFGDSREGYLKALVGHKTYRGFGVVKDGKLKGYGFLRKNEVNYTIGPFIADDEEAAKEIFSGLQSLIVGEEIDAIFIEDDKVLKKIANKEKWEHTETFYRMFAKGIPKFATTNKAYIPLLELG